jgi:hypothetical protein
LSSNSTIAVLVGVSVLAISSTSVIVAPLRMNKESFVTYFTKGLLDGGVVSHVESEFIVDVLRLLLLIR